jgi:hypothetical protein
MALDLTEEEVTVIIFEDPPGRSREYTKHAPIAAELRENPGQWGRVSSYTTGRVATHMAYSVRSARIKAYAPAGAFEAEGRTESGQHRLYVRYVGQGA